MKRKVISMMMAMVIVVVFSVPVFAEGSVNEKTEQDIVTIEDNDLSLSSLEKREYNNYCREIANVIAENEGDISDISKGIKSVAKENKDIVECLKDGVSDAISEDVDNDNNTSTVVRFSDECADLYERTIDINDETTVTINPLGVIVSMPVENNTIEDCVGVIKDDMISTYVPMSYAAAKKSKCGVEHGIIGYNIVGTKLWGVFVECDFYYNGEKAWYQANYDGYAKRYLSGLLWSHYNGKVIKEKDGTSYHAGYACNVSWGLQVKGQGLVFQDKRCKVNLYCSKKGKITKTDSVK